MSTSKMSGKSVKLGHAKTLLMHMSGPMEMIAQEIDLKDFTILIGTNGVGKSMVLKVTWVMNMITGAIMGKIPNLEESAQFILDHSITELGLDNLMVLGIRYESGALVKLYVSDGKVNKVEYSGLEKVKDPVKPVFMSTTMRLFTAWKPRIYTGRFYTLELESYISKILNCNTNACIVKMPYKYMRHQPDQVGTLADGGLLNWNSWKSLELDTYKLGYDRCNYLIETAGGYRNVNTLLSMAAYRTEECVDGKVDLSYVGKESGITVKPNWGQAMMISSQKMLDGESHIKSPVFLMDEPGDLPF